MTRFVNISIVLVSAFLLLSHQSISQTVQEKAPSLHRPDFSDTTEIYKVAYVPNCSRFMFYPLLKPGAYLKETFLVSADSLSAIETAILNNGDTLIIKHTGCDSIIYKLRFKTKRFQFDTKKEWYDAVLVCMSELTHMLNADLALDSGLESLTRYYKETRRPEYNVVIEYCRHLNGLRICEPKYFTKFLGVKKLKNEYYEISILFGVGPIGSL